MCTDAVLSLVLLGPLLESAGEVPVTVALDTGSGSLKSTLTINLFATDGPAGKPSS